MNTFSFVTSLGTSFGVFVLLLLLYSWMSSLAKNKMIYYPNMVRKGLDPWVGRSGKKNPFCWVKEAILASEDEIISMAGVDFATYLVFLKTVTRILVLSGVVLLPVLLPIARTDNNLSQVAVIAPSGSEPRQTITFDDFDKLTMGNVKEKSLRLWAFMVGTWWVTLITYLMLWKGYKHVLNLRTKSMKSSLVAKPEDYTVLVSDIPPLEEGQTRQEQVDSYFRRLYSDHFFKSMVVTNNTQVEAALAEVMMYKNELAHVEAEIEESSNQDNNGDQTTRRRRRRRRRRRGIISPADFCSTEEGEGEEETDRAITYYKSKIDSKLSNLLEAQVKTLEQRQQAAALVFFNSRRVAVMASQTLHSQFNAWTVKKAPEPRQLIWSNLARTSSEIQVRSTIVSLTVFLTVAFYMVPITFLSALTTLENLEKVKGFKFLDKQPAVKLLLEAYLPQLSLFLFMALLPKVLMFLSRTEGCLCKSHAVEAASGKYYYFIIFNVFLGVTLGGSLIASARTVADNPARIVELLGGSLPGSATFFLTFVALKFFIGYGVELSRLGKLSVFRFRSHYFLKTEDELRRAWAPGQFKYATKVPNDILIVTICLCYSVIAPLIVLFGTFYCGLGWLISRNQALKVFIPSYDSNGRMWPHMFRRIIASLIIYQTTMIGYFGIKKFYYASILIPLPMISIIFAYICWKRFDATFYRTPLDVVDQEANEKPADMEAICKAYVPSSLSFQIPDRIKRQRERNGDDSDRDSKDEEEGGGGDSYDDGGRTNDIGSTNHGTHSRRKSMITRSDTVDFDF